MKAPKLADLNEIGNDNAFSKAIQTEQSRATGIVRKTYSLQQRHEDYINAVATAMSQERGKPVNASEALRAIINRDIERAGE